MFLPLLQVDAELPDSFINQLEVDLDNQIDLDGELAILKISK